MTMPSQFNQIFAADTAFNVLRPADPFLNGGRKEVVFIENDVADYQSLVNGVKAGVAVVLLDSTKDGLSAMADWATIHSGYDAIHIFSHGSDATLLLGARTVNNASLTDTTVKAELAQIGQALTVDGDLLLYGCNVAADEDGQLFLTNLAVLTGADVAGSEDLTGSTKSGGDWQLEFHSGTVTADPLEQESYSGLLGVSATFGFEAGTSGIGTKNPTQTVSGETLSITSTVVPIVDSSTTSGMDISGAVTLSTDYGTAFETRLVYSVPGKIFDFSGITIFNVNVDETFTFTASSGATYSVLILAGETKSVDLSANNGFQGVSSVTLTAINPYAIDFDDIVLSNITTPGPTVISATYDASSNILVVTGTNMTAAIGATNDIDVSKLTITGQGGASYTLTSSNVEIDSGTQFTVTLNAADQINVEGLLNKDGTAAADTTTFNIAAADDWCVNATTGDTSDATNAVTVINTQAPTLTSAFYNAATGVLAVTGSNLVKANGATNDITVSNLTLTGEGGSTYQLTTSDVEITDGSSFSITLNATDLAALNQIFNKAGTSSTGGTTYNIAAADDWNTVITDRDISDTTGNGITVSNPITPTITSATYNAATGELVVAGTGFLKLGGAANDVDVSKLTITGEGGATYTLTTPSVEITNGTSFAVTLNATDLAGVNQILNKAGTSSVGGITYNLSAAEDWAAGADAALVIADTTGNGITVSNPINAAPSLTATGADPTFTEGSSAVTLFSSAVVSTVESGQTITDLTLTVTNVSDSTESLTIDGSTVNLINGNSGTTAANGLLYAVSLTAGTATVGLSGGTLSTAQTQTLVDALAYANSSDAPTTGAGRVVTITGIKDSGGTSNGGSDSTVLSFASTVTLSAVNDAPSVTGLPTDITVVEDISSNVDLSAVTISDVDSGNNNITVTIAAGAGTLAASSGGGVTIAGSGSGTLVLSGTVSNIDTYLNTVSNVQYTGATNASGNDASTLTITANDGGNSGSGGGTTVTLGTVNVDITDVNDAPVISSNGGGAAAAVNVAENQTTVTTFTATDLDGDTPSFSISGGADQALFTINAATGVLTFIVAPNFEVPGDANADNDYVVEVTTRDGNAGTDSQTITVTVTDVTEAPPADDDPAPVTTPTTTTTHQTINGVPVVTTVDANGNQTISATVPSSAGTSAEVPISPSSGDATGVTVSAPPLVTITATGPGSLQTQSQASSTLLSLLDSTGNSLGMNLGLGSFISGLGSNVQVSSSSVVLTGAGGTSSSPIVFSGSAGNSFVDVLIIDTRALPSGAYLQLDNIEFAAVLGQSTVTGGTGSNVAYGDGAPQYIVLGQDDDTLHGGAGNDTVGSQAGNDWLYGDEGDDTLFGGDGHNVMHGGTGFDTALFTGDRSDYLIVSRGAQIMISPRSAPDTVDTLVNIEQLQFADQTIAVDGAPLGPIVTLYQNILSRQADTDGLTFWTQQIQNGASVGQLALAFIESSEFATGTGTDITYIDASAQIETFYEAILSRASDEAGKAYWKQKLGSGASLTDVATGFVESTEFEQLSSDVSTWNFFF